MSASQHPTDREIPRWLQVQKEVALREQQKRKHGSAEERLYRKQRKKKNRKTRDARRRARR